MFAAIGIVKGEPFNPDATQRLILDKAAKTAFKMSRVIGFEKNVSGRSFPHLSRQTGSILWRTERPRTQVARWTSVAGTDRGYLDLDARIWFFTDYYSISPGMLSQTPEKVRSIWSPLQTATERRCRVVATIA